MFEGRRHNGQMDAPSSSDKPCWLHPCRRSGSPKSRCTCWAAVHEREWTLQYQAAEVMARQARSQGRWEVPCSGMCSWAVATPQSLLGLPHRRHTSRMQWACWGGRTCRARSMCKCVQLSMAGCLQGAQTSLPWQLDPPQSSPAYRLIAYESDVLKDPGLHVPHPPVSVQPTHGDVSSCGAGFAGAHRLAASAGMQNRHVLTGPQGPQDAELQGGQPVPMQTFINRAAHLQNGSPQLVVHAHSIAEWFVDRSARPIFVARRDTGRVLLAHSAHKDAFRVLGCTCLRAE